MVDFSLQGRYIINAKLVCETGLHIGGATTGFEIGGIDNPVVKDALTEEPYIPGSSLKGKLRALLEWSLGKNKFSKYPHHFAQGKKGSGQPTFSPCDCGQCVSCVLFGVTPDSSVRDKENHFRGVDMEDSFAAKVVVEEDGKERIFFYTGPTRLTVRDSFLDPESKAEMEKLLGKGFYTEVKTENALDRVTAEANPRPMERVPKGAAFDIEMVLDVYRADVNRADDRKLLILKALFEAMHLLEDSALGGTSSRGSGKVRFTDLSAKFRDVSYYSTGGKDGQKPVTGIPDNVAGAIESFGDIEWNFPVPPDS